MVQRTSSISVSVGEAWINWANHESLTPNEVSALEVDSIIIMEPFTTKQDKGSIFVELTVPVIRSGFYNIRN